jgi:Ca2+-binding RTX toxin-like protein
VGGDRAWSNLPPYGDDARPTETLVTGDDLSGRWGALVADATELLALHYEYRPLEQNSNTFVTTLLQDVGLPQPARQIFLDGFPGVFVTPAYQYQLHDPLGSTSPPPQSLGPSDFRFGDAAPNQTAVAAGDSNITVQWSDNTIAVTADGENIANLIDIPLDTTIGAASSITGIDGHVVLVGSSGNDTFDGNGSDCLMLAGPGDDTFLLGYSGSNWIDGGSGDDTAQYTQSDTSVTVSFSSQNDVSITGGPIIKVSEDGTAGVDTLVSVEKLRLSDHNDTVTLKSDDALALSKVKEIDAGDQDGGGRDILDLSEFDGDLSIVDGKLTGTDISIKLDNFEEIIGLNSNDTLDLSGTSVTKVEGGSGDDIIVGGDSYSILLGGDGDDQLTAGGGGATLDGGIDDNTYTGGAGADTFIIGSGTHAREGWDVGASFTINNAGANDRLVLRLAQSAGIGSDPDLTKGIVLNGGLQLDGQSGGLFSTIPVEPIIQGQFPGDETRWVTGTTLGPVTSELGNLVIGYNWDQENSILDIDIMSNFNEYSVRVNGFQEGQLGIHFTHPQLDQIKYFIGIPDPKPIQDTWDAFNSAMQQVVANPEIVDIASPGDPLDIVGSTATPSPDGTSLTPRFDVEEGGDNFAAPSLNGLKFDSQIAQLVSAMATYSPPGADFDSASFGLHMIPNASNPQNALAAAWH